MKTVLIAVFTWLFLPGITSARKQGQLLIDSLLSEVPKMKEDSIHVKVMDGIAYTYCTINPDEGIKWARKELALAQKLNWKRGQAMAYNVLGANQMTKGIYPEALSTYYKALQLFEDLDDQKLLPSVKNDIGTIYFYQEKYVPALEWKSKALQQAEKTGNKRMMMHTMSGMGLIYFQTGQHNKALEYQLKALALAEERGEEIVAVQIKGNIALAYMASKDYNAALAYTFGAMRWARDNGVKQLMVPQLANAGISYLAIAKGDKVPQPDSLVPATRSGNISRAIAFLKDAMTTAEETQFLYAMPDIAEATSQAFEYKGDHKAALSAYKHYYRIQDSIHKMANNEKIAALETQRALTLKEKDIKIAELEVVKKRNERIFYIAGIGLLLVIIGILIFNFRRHMRSRQRIKELQDHKISLLDEAVKRRTDQLGSMRQTIATDFHDQTGNMLAAITRQAATLELKLLGQQEVLPIVRSIISNSNELYLSSKDFLWNLNHDSDDPVVLFQYLCGYGQRYYNQFDISFSSEINGDAQSHMQLTHLAGINLIYIFKEAMSNVIKHSGADEVTMELTWITGYVIYSLKDNGRWKELDANTEHYGLSNMERRSRQSGFKYEISHNISGTRIDVIMPVSVDSIHI